MADNNIKEKVLSFLLDFENYYWKYVPTTAKGKDAVWEQDSYIELKEALELNIKYPSNLFFTPNGNYWLINNKNSHSELNPKTPGPWCWFNAFVLNFNNIRSEDNFLEKTKSKILKFTTFKWRYIIKSPHWYHFYFVIEKEDRESLFDEYGYKLLEITKALAKYLWADTSSKNFLPGSLFRFPYSKYWEVANTYDCEIVDVQQYYITKYEIQDMISCIKDIKKRTSTIDKLLAWEQKQYFKELLKKDINDIIAYTNDEDITHQQYIIADNKIIPVLWKNIFQYPSGNAIELLYCLYKWDNKKILEQLKTLLKFKDVWEDKLDFTLDLDSENLNNELLDDKCETYSYWDSSIELKEWYVVYNYVQKWKTINKVIFRDTIKIFWRWEQNVWVMGSEWTINKKVYYIKINWEDKLLYECDSKKDFYKKNWIFFFGIDQDLCMFFLILNKSREINDVNIYQRNWYYNSVCVLWDRIVAWDKNENGLIMLWENGFNLCDDKKQISVKEIFWYFRQCYEDELIVPLFLSVISLCWMNLWNAHEVYPAVLLTGTTWTGKSTLADLLRQICWYWPEARKLTFRWLTEQPLKIAWSDNAMLCLEELTKTLWPVEQLVRNIINHDMTSRWALETNYTWKLRAWLFAVWERTFADESLNNRCATFVMTEKYWNKNAKEMMKEIQQYTAYEDIYSTFLWCKDYINDLAKEKKDKLIELWLSWRAADVWSYSLVVNDIFCLWVEPETLVRYIKNHLWRMWLADVKTQNDAETLLIWYLRTAINRKKISFLIDVNDIYDDNSLWSFKVLFDFLDEDEYEKNRWKLNSCIIDLNSKYWDDIVSIDQYWLSFKEIKLEKKSWPSESKWDQFIIISTCLLLRQIWQRLINEYNWQQLLVVKDWLTDYHKI